MDELEKKPVRRRPVVPDAPSGTPSEPDAAKPRRGRPRRADQAATEARGPESSDAPRRGPKPRDLATELGAATPPDTRRPRRRVPAPATGAGTVLDSDSLTAIQNAQKAGSETHRDFPIETAVGRAIVKWDPALRERANLANEDLHLRVIDPADLSLLAEYRVNQLSAKQLSLAPGRYRFELARVRKPELSSRSSLEPSPALNWIQDSPGSHVVIWGDLDWDAIQKEVVQIHKIDWARDSRVSLRVEWMQKDGTIHQSWIPVPERDHATLHGRARRIELAVVHAESGSILKSLLWAERVSGEVVQVLRAGVAEIPKRKESLVLVREIVETDTLQVRADWDTDDDGTPLRLKLEKDGQEVQPDPQRTVPHAGNWYFHGLLPGVYQAHLFKGRSRKPFLSSQPVTLRAPGSRAVLMPMTEELAFAYWHVDTDIWAGLANKHGDLLGRVTCYLDVYQEYAGEWWHKPELSPEVNLNTTRDYYLNLPPDRLYQVRVVAMIDGVHAEPLTPNSNRVQLGRFSAGTNPVAHKWQPQNLEHPTVRSLTGPKNPSRFSQGYLLLHLHAHLPYIAENVNFDAGEVWRPAGYPQEWYPEAVRETYLPLLDLFEQLTNEGVDFKLSMDISPPLAAMMKSQRHQSDALEYLERLIQLARLEVERTAREEPHYTTAARMHLRHLTRNRDLFLAYGGDLTRGFRKFQEMGVLELCTCIGTHPMLPLWMDCPSAIRAQAFAAAQFHERTFGRPSNGVWLPECAYTPGVEPFLEEAGFRYFFSENLTVVRGDARAEFDVNAPVYTRGHNLAIFPRDPETGEQVWSGEQGYPGDADYLEFHIRGGPFKYNRITDRRGGWKQPYNPEWAERKAASHAGHFMFCRNARFEYLRKVMWKKPLIVAPYDAELFGHHWYEGPRFLYYLFKKLHHDQNVTELITPSAYLVANPTSQDLYPSTSSWGKNGTFEKWMQGDTSWMYRHVHEAAREMNRLAQRTPDNDVQRRALVQAGRELMIAMSSDLPFVISNGHFIDRMKDEFFGALRNFWRLAEMVEHGNVDVDWLLSLEIANCTFPELDPRWFA